MTIYFPTYNALTMGTQLTQERYDNFICKVALGNIPEGKFSDAEKTIPLNSPCWDWQAYRDKGGYGQFNFTAGKSGLAHRVSAFLAGLILNIKSQSDDDKVLHKCDNKSCVNPDHFFIGTHKNNMDDMVEKGRQATGEQNGMAKLTWEQVKEIRARYTAGNISLRQLGRDYGVDKVLIYYIISNKRWHDKSYTPPQTRLSQTRLSQTRLSQEQRAEVVALYSQGGTTQQSIAKLYNVSQQAIHSIIHKGT